jgi:hypothetical protein
MFFNVLSFLPGQFVVNIVRFRDGVTTKLCSNALTFTSSPVAFSLFTIEDVEKDDYYRVAIFSATDIILDREFEFIAFRL